MSNWDFNQKLKDDYAQAKRISTSYEGEQECLCMALLMRHGVNFVLLKPRKIKQKNSKSLAALFMTIDEIHIGQQRFKFSELIHNEINEAEKTITSIADSRKTKYRKRNLVSATNNFLYEMLKSIGYNTSLKSTRATHYVIKMKRIKSISGFGVDYQTWKDISLIGQQINQKFRSEFEDLNTKREMPVLFQFHQISSLMFPDISGKILDSLLIDFIFQHRDNNKKNITSSINDELIDIPLTEIEKEKDIVYRIVDCAFGRFFSQISTHSSNGK
ncbi:hypothetical protein EHI8A_022900 [Entamoeba histolytica HM-1:IMSS-B]|uniref:Uncharacterized protein n=6 Tax=Entamoeba histolytica TaxID=5759 RepID=C4M440_ENTH1|nr:hypothetical protein EHI_030060 [Entamoeba histolytica HM-1:IMSS]EMD44933.1 Hypothetical protein EHI5A_034900 [Entamoeba histolytica KU27]EMH76705.1 hypothetical protein EHI8A_022900 [Entamoeba histolytica HM-1:IMSS-B]EMS11548.1 hypothetical protein KM1_055650 [Entamoeba histolytica HM-3:IMSS]ENY62812.1 hypothetical protein EHI7A_026020 [Entamoeba histolytica HM-1:IMSS-A]GAT96114.1 hypothetical protein CL6EHI_030060 [Entamoeba histolytica]|eukprot:XP_653775.1 hypothetical protein EHI_030060 [Entamoeba histolytica HM-1:IMSS]